MIEHDPIVLHVSIWPTMRSLRRDSRYGPHLERLGLDRPPEGAVVLAIGYKLLMAWMAPQEKDAVAA